MAIPKEGYTKKAGGGRSIIKKEEVQAGVQPWLREGKPPLLAGGLEEAFEAQGHKLIFTPPYSPNFQPIELLWRGTKNFATWGYQHNRAPDKAASDAMGYW